MLFFGGVQVFLSQIPTFSKLWWLSIVAAVMSFAYSSIGVGLGIGNLVISSKFQYNIFILRKTYKHFSHDKQRNVSFTDKGHFHGTLGGMVHDSDGFQMHDIWLVFQALGNIAFAYSYSMILIEIQVSYLFYWKKKNTLIYYNFFPLPIVIIW